MSADHDRDERRAGPIVAAGTGLLLLACCALPLLLCCGLPLIAAGGALAGVGGLLGIPGSSVPGSPSRWPSRPGCSSGYGGGTEAAGLAAAKILRLLIGTGSSIGSSHHRQRGHLGIPRPFQVSTRPATQRTDAKSP